MDVYFSSMKPCMGRTLILCFLESAVVLREFDGDLGGGKKVGVIPSRKVAPCSAANPG